MEEEMAIFSQRPENIEIIGYLYQSRVTYYHLNPEDSTTSTVTAASEHQFRCSVFAR